jgi:AAA15 family ATPase/GTPase
MYVESLKISGFTSFKEVVWKPERLNVLFGPNGSGKSNLLRALGADSRFGRRQFARFRA